MRQSRKQARQAHRLLLLLFLLLFRGFSRLGLGLNLGARRVGITRSILVRFLRALELLLEKLCVLRVGKANRKGLSGRFTVRNVGRHIVHPRAVRADIGLELNIRRHCTGQHDEYVQ